MDMDMDLQMTFPFSNMVMFQPSENLRSLKKSASTATSEASDVSDTAAQWHPQLRDPNISSTYGDFGILHKWMRFILNAPR